MIVELNQIPSHSKLWIFPSNRKFYTDEIPEIKSNVELFLNNLIDSNQNYDIGFCLKYDRFIVIAIDDSELSIPLNIHNSLIEFILSLEKKHNVILLDKINVCFKQGEFVQYKDAKEFKKLIKNKSVSNKTIVFNNLISTVEEFNTDWEINIMDSWLGRLL